jgi:hypothetical protein
MAHLRETYEDAKSIYSGILKINTIINTMNKEKLGKQMIYCIHGPIEKLDKVRYK